MVIFWTQPEVGNPSGRDEFSRKGQNRPGEDIIGNRLPVFLEQIFFV